MTPAFPSDRPIPSRCQPRPRWMSVGSSSTSPSPTPPVTASRPSTRCPGALPVASNVNFVVGQTVPNLVITGIGSSGQFGVFNQQGFTHVIVDEFGYFTSG